MEKEVFDYLLLNYGILGIVAFSLFLYVRKFIQFYEKMFAAQSKELENERKEFRDYLLKNNEKIVIALSHNTEALNRHSVVIEKMTEKMK